VGSKATRRPIGAVLFSSFTSGSRSKGRREACVLREQPLEREKERGVEGEGALKKAVCSCGRMLLVVALAKWVSFSVVSKRVLCNFPRVEYLGLSHRKSKMEERSLLFISEMKGIFRPLSWISHDRANADQQWLMAAQLHSKHQVYKSPFQGCSCERNVPLKSLVAKCGFVTCKWRVTISGGFSEG
jgi:hypothetical protein